jgi:hypothetical protein
VVVRVTDDDDQSDEDTLVVTVIEGSKSNADLAILKLSKGTLEPGFKPVTLIYSAQVAHADSQVTVEAVPADPDAKVAVNGKSLGSGGTSEALTLKVGTSLNAFQVVVTAQDGTQKIYAVSMTRLPSSEARLASLDAVGFALKPGFSPAAAEYADTVAASVVEIGLKPVPMESNATVSINDTAFSGSSARTFKLLAGANAFKIVVTAQDGVTKRTYTVNVARRARLILSQKLAGADPVVLDTTEVLPGVPDSLKASSVTGFVFRGWSVVEGTAEISDTGKAATMGVLRSGEVHIQAGFDVRKYVIRTKAGAGGSFSVDSAEVEHGKDFTVTVTPLVTHRVLSVKDGGNEIKLDIGPGITAPKEITLKAVTADHALEAEFRRVYALKASVTGEGKVDPESITADSGTTHAFTFVPNKVPQHLSALEDNGKSVIDLVAGDVMKSATYKLESVNGDHELTGAFTIKTYELTVVGIDVCLRQPVTCPPGQICPILLCSLEKDPPDSTTITVNHGSTWIISTLKENPTTGQPFRTWSGGPPTATTNPDTVVITSNAKYRASYGLIIRECPPLCVVDPIDPILIPASAATVREEDLEAIESPGGDDVTTRPPEEAN